jgi:predicted RNA-binding Zn-ribbon protein involved in translation (DUF1610 family)
MRQLAKEARRPRKTNLPMNRQTKKTKTSRRVTSGATKPKASPVGTGRGIMFCPKCGSPNIFWASGLPHLWSIWECRNCGYRGAFIVRDGELAVKVRENYAKRTFRH